MCGLAESTTDNLGNVSDAKVKRRKMRHWIFGTKARQTKLKAFKSSEASTLSTIKSTSSGARWNMVEEFERRGR
jgi:hypothetical protein